MEKFKYCKISFLDEVEIKKEGKGNLFVSCEEKNPLFEYPNKEKFAIPFKNTVTGLNSNKSQTEKFATKAWLTKSVQLNLEEDKALIGTHYHTALEKLDFCAPYNKNTNFEDVDYEKIKKAHSAISGIVKNAVKIKKEAEFMLYIPYNELVESEIEDKVLVQGVVDLIIEEEDGFIIVDYKFSSLPIHILKQKYAEQLALYKLAVEKAFKKPVKQTLIYSINSGELF